MRFYMMPVVYEDALHDATAETYDREFDLYELFEPENDTIFIGLSAQDIEEDAIHADLGDANANYRNMIRYLLRHYFPVDTDEAIIVLD